MGTLMAVERVTCHLIRVIAGRTQALTRRIHACSLKILVGLERLVVTRHTVERRAFLERERVHRYMMRFHRQYAIERALPAYGGLPGKATHQVAGHIEPSVLNRGDGCKGAVRIVDTANRGKLGVVEGLDSQRNARDAHPGKRRGELRSQRLGIGLAGKLNGLTPRRDTPGKFYQTLPRQRRRAAANIDGADLCKRACVAKAIEARIQLPKISIERSAQVARSNTARVKVAVPALLGAKRHMHVQRGNGHR